MPNPLEDGKISKDKQRWPPELFTRAYTDIVNVSSVIGCIAFQYGDHDLGEPLCNLDCGLRLVVVGGAPIVETFRYELLVLQEPIEMIPILEIILPAATQQIKTWY